MFKKITLIILYCFSGIIFKNYAQNLNYSQFIASGVHISPTFVAHKNRHSVGIINRNQWFNLNSKFTFTQADANFAINTNNRHIGGVGLQFENDITGDLKYTQQAIYLNMAYDLTLDDLNEIFFGVKIGGLFYSVNTDNISTGGDYIPGIGDGNLDEDLPQQPKNGLDMGFGLTYQLNSEKTSDAPVYMLAGVSLLNTYNPYSDREGNSTFGNYIAFANLQYLASEKTEFGPVVVLDTYTGGETFIQYGLSGTYKLNNDSDENVFAPSFFSLFAYYNTGKAMVPELRVGNRYYNLGLSTDLYLGDLKTYRTYEISLRISFGKLKTGSNKVINNTPRYQHTN